MLDVVLIVIAILAAGFLIQLIFHKFPHLVNINTNSLPTIKAQRQKQLILQGRLQRSYQGFAKKVKVWLEPWQDQINSFFTNYYQRLKNFERDLKLRGQQQLTTMVSKSQAIDDLLTSARQSLNTENYQAAEEALLDILSQDQHNVEAYKLLAEVYRARKEYEQAKETLEYLLKLTHDSDPSIYYSLADIAKQRGNLKQAAEDYLKSISISEDNYLYFLSLAEVYLDLEEKEKSLQAAQRALILAPNNPKILDFLVNLCIIIQDKRLAQQYFKKLKDVNPENNKLLDFGERLDTLK